MIAEFRKKIKGIYPKIYWREILAVLMLMLAIIFFRSQRNELKSIIPHISQSDPFWITLGFILTLSYFLFNGGMYRQSFAAIGLRLFWDNAIVLFLKRNFVSVFLPAGGISSLAYSPSQIRNAGFNKKQVHQASGIFGFIGLLTLFLVGLPVIIYTVLKTNQFKDSWFGLMVVLIIVGLLYAGVHSVKTHGVFYRWLDKKFPSLTPALDELFDANVNTKNVIGVIIYSLGIELCGILHIYIAMLALGFPASLGASAAAYIISVLLMVVSPFLRGLGAVEISMVFVLQQFGYSAMQSISITILYRVFEFWLPLLAGILTYLWKGSKIFIRIAPALLTFTLGIVNIISVVTTPDLHRLRLLREYVATETIHASNLMILFVGVSLLITSAYLFRGLRNAWLLSLLFAILSLFGNLSKALDYEEAIVAAVTLIILIITSSQYRVKSNPKWMKAGLKMAFMSFGAVILFGFTSFYFVEKRHFETDFSWQQSLVHTLKSFLLVEDDSLQPATKFSHELIWVIRILGFFTWAFLLFALIKPSWKNYPINFSLREKAKSLLNEFGDSTTDHFKIYKDKLLFFSEFHEAFIAYRIANGFAIILEEPVCAEENKIEVLEEFDRVCLKMGLKTAFYRVDENSIPWFNHLRKKKLLIGQEAILEINSFILDGKDKKSLRNGLSSLQKKGFYTMVHTAPHANEFVDQLKFVSQNWLETFQKKEMVFSQGVFDENEIINQDIICLHSEEGKIKAFLNIIPDYAEDECTYDLIRKTEDAPGAAMDALVIKMIEYAKAEKKLFLNLGLVPMTGIINPENTAERIIKLASLRIKRFNHYRGLREFKEKYATIWENKYLVYENDFDLIELPLALNQVMKP